MRSKLPGHQVTKDRSPELFHAAIAAAATRVAVMSDIGAAMIMNPRTAAGPRRTAATAGLPVTATTRPAIIAPALPKPAR